jgi:hypothetical protein
MPKQPIRSYSASMLNTTTQSGDTLHTTLKSAPMMKSVRFHGSGDIRVDEIEEPMCSKGQVKVCIMVQVTSCNINVIVYR